MKIFFLVLALFTFQSSFSQKLSKADKITLANIQSHIRYLSDDKLEGRRTGTKGEQLAYEYISSEYQKLGLLPKGDQNGWLQQFTINEGKQVDRASHLIINGHDLQLNTDYFPLAMSPNASVEGLPIVSLSEPNTPWFFDLKDLLEKNKSNPHLDITSALHQKTEELAKKGATAVFVYNTSELPDGLAFDGRSKAEYAKLPIAYLTKTAAEKFLKDDQATLDVKLKVEIKDKVRYGHNVIGYIDNGAPTTVVLGAHYDHLGYGEDKNSLHVGGSAIHNGADDNASGTAAILELARMLKKDGPRRNNYLFISFSGEELGLYGSKHFTSTPTIDLSKVNYMINLDMVGRLNDSSKAITVGGYGTSPSWGKIILPKTKTLVIKTDSSGTGPSDHTSFYRKDIPVLFFFTGTHSDYHKPGDDFEKINFNGEVHIINYIYKVIEETDKLGKLAFTKTREQQMGTSTRFTVSLGIMPDYTFSGTGVKVDGVSQGKIAEKVGIKAGDIIVELGPHKFTDVMSYMTALSKFKKGDSTKVKVKRGGEELMYDVTF
jgi:aminopeptidase YwaD